MDEAVSMSYYRTIQGGEDEILQTVAEQGPVLVSIDHRTRTFQVYVRLHIMNNMEPVVISCVPGVM